jgi:hypothetical protein
MASGPDAEPLLGHDFSGARDLSRPASAPDREPLTSDHIPRPVVLPDVTEPLRPFADYKTQLSRYAATHAHEPTFPAMVYICLKKAKPQGCCDLQTAVAGEYRHVELLFMPVNPYSGGYPHKFTVDLASGDNDATGRVRMELKDLTRRPYIPKRWDCFKLPMSPVEILGLRDFCTRQIGKPMDGRGLYYNFICFLSCCVGDGLDEEEQYFCSQLVMVALQYVWPDRFDGVNSRKVKPLDLVRILQEVGAKLGDPVGLVLSRTDGVY